MSDEQLIISRRDALLGPSINCRTQKAGDEAGAKATDLALSGIHLSAEEFCAILREPLAHKAYFVQRPGSRLLDPLFPRIGPIVLLDKFEHAVVTLYAGLQGTEIKLGICRLARIHLQPKTGGLAEMSCQVQATPTLDRRIATLLDAMAAAVQVEITYEHNAEQPDLALSGETPRDEDDEDEDDKPTRGRRGRKNGHRPEAA